MQVDIFKYIPAWSRKAVRAVLPARVVDRARARLIWFLYERDKSTVQRGPQVVAKARRALGAKPALFHLDVHITDHCNMRCKGCSHFSNIAPAYFTDVGEFARDLRRMSELFVVKEIFLLGGEPLLHARVDEFVRIAHECFPKAHTYLFTNSLLVTKMPEAVWQALADTGIVLYCDRYPVGLPIADIEALAASHAVTLKWTEDRDRFFTIPIDIEGRLNAEESFAACSGVDNCVNLRHGRLYPCARIAYIDIFREKYGIEGLEATVADSISIFGDDVEAWSVMDFLLAPVPWCRHCDQANLTWYPWERGGRSMEQWTEPGERRAE